MSVDPVQEKFFNVRAAIPDAVDVLTTWRQRSDAYKLRSPRAQLDLAYGESAEQTLDYYPANETGGPLMMFIHGGYWQTLDKADSGFIAGAMVDAGVNVAVVNYDLCPHVNLSTIVEQMQSALQWLRSHAEDLGADPTRLFVSGHSAGGHLTGMLMATAAPNVIRGGLAVSGLFDLRALVNTTINDKVGLTMETAFDLSPMLMKPVDHAPVILAVGGKESQGFHDQSIRFGVQWRNAGARAELVSIAGCDHLRAIEALTEPDSNLFARTMCMISGD